MFDCNGKQDCWRMVNNFEKREFQETQNSFLRLPGALSDVEIGGERGSKITDQVRGGKENGFDGSSDREGVVLASSLVLSLFRVQCVSPPKKPACLAF